MPVNSTSASARARVDRARAGSRHRADAQTSSRARSTSRSSTAGASRSGGKESSDAVVKRLRKRLSVMRVVLCVLLAYVSVRTVLIQTVWRGAYHAASVDYRTRVNIVRADRGVIFDRNGQELALSVPSQTLFIDPLEVSDAEGTGRAVAGLLGMSTEAEAGLIEKIAARRTSFIYLARQIDKSIADAVLALRLPGVSSYTEPRRVVESDVAAALIGKTDPDGVGISGLELQFNKILQGIDGRAVRAVDSNGRSIPGQTSGTSAPKPGDDLVLTIDKALQFHADQILMQRVAQVRGKSGSAIIMNTATGEIYAMSNVKTQKDGTVGLAPTNYAAVNANEPGSVAKIFSLSASLDLGRTTDATVYKVPGSIKVDEYVIRDAYPHGLVQMSTRDIIRESSNIGTTMLSEGVSTSELRGYLQAFGFGDKTGLDYPNEASGILKSRWYGTERLTTAYGYGYATTPLQTIAAVNAVANSGVYVAPKLVKSTIDGSGRLKDTRPSNSRTVLKPATASTVTSILKDVVCYGTGKNAQVKGMKVAGKTGTGYKAQDNGTYVTTSGGRRYFASFVGYFPADAPRVTILVTIDEPDARSRDRFGGTAAAPVFAKLAQAAMQVLQIHPTGTGTGCKPLLASTSLP